MGVEERGGEERRGEGRRGEERRGEERRGEERRGEVDMDYVWNEGVSLLAVILRVYVCGMEGFEGGFGG